MILPISDPYLAHHGALGGYATVYLEDKSKLQDTMALLRQTPGIYTVMGKHDAAKALDLPVDRIGDFVRVESFVCLLGDDILCPLSLLSLTLLPRHWP